MLKRLLKQTLSGNPILQHVYYWTARGQSDECDILDKLTANTHTTRTFVEFGFHSKEFNCAALMRRGWHGLLIDGNAQTVANARIAMPASVRCVSYFLTRDNLSVVREAFPALGVISIDVDGNDYWFMKDLIDIRPSIICVEYNASFLNEPVTVPYDAAFDRHAKDASGWYHGASLLALTTLARTNGYGLAAVSQGGANAFFTGDGDLDPLRAWRPNTLRDKWSGTTPEDQWKRVARLPLVKV